MATNDDFALGPRDIHIWYADLDQAACSAHPFANLLSKDEQLRASKFHFDTDKNRYIAAHGILRKILGRYLNANPSDIRFDVGDFEKPRLRHPWSSSGLRFNMSHSRGCGMFAVARNRDIGIDIEFFREVMEMEDIAQSTFNPEEHLALLRIPRGNRQTAFFSCWTRKEAFVKAIGQGLSYPLNLFQVSVTPNPGECDLLLGHNTGDDWSIWDIPAGPEAAAALAASGDCPLISYKRWTTPSVLEKQRGKMVDRTRKEPCIQ
jgi:4'-phosphopantetheinyl transferase